MKKLLMLLLFLLVISSVGCTVTAGFYVEKDWATNPGTPTDLNTRFKIEGSRNFQ